MIKGSNRRMFRKPGMARQAIGILASSKELMDAAQAGQMPMEPVQSFANGGFANTAYGFMNLAPPGFTMTGEGDDATLEPVSGLGGAYQRLSGIRDPSRARQQSGMDLLELGARIAAGQSTSSTENIANALIPTIDKIGKRREKELATDLAVAQLKDKKEEKELTRLRETAKAQRDLNKPFNDELYLIGASVDPNTGFIMYGKPVDGQQPVYRDIASLKKALSPEDLKTLNSAMDRGVGGTASERMYKAMIDDTTIQAYLQMVTNNTSELPRRTREERIYVDKLRPGIQNKGGVIFQPQQDNIDSIRILDFNNAKVLDKYGSQDMAFERIVLPEEYDSAMYFVKKKQDPETRETVTEYVVDRNGNILNPEAQKSLAQILQNLN